MYKNKKIVVICMMILVIFTQSLSNWIYFLDGKNNITQASGPVEENKLVAIFVEQSIYSSIEKNLQRYATDYIQGRFPRTKALIFPVDTTTIQPQEIQKILSNLYHGGEKDIPSTLIGTILIGNIPLPTIATNNNGTTGVQKTILPYTDIEKPSFVYNSEKNIFTESLTQVDKQQELFHGIIIFDTINKYNNYFEKIKKYINNPSSFATKKIWYEDFIQLQKNYIDQNIPLYAKKQIFDEDLLYHRYTPAVFNILTAGANQDAIHIFNDKLQTATDSQQTISTFSPEEIAYNKSLAERENNLADQANKNKDLLKDTTQGENIPTLIMGQSILQQTKKYSDLFAPEYGDIIFNQFGSRGRWTGVDIGNTITKIETFDQASSSLLFSINTLFEENIDKKISGDNLSLHIPLPVAFSQFQSCIDGKKYPKNDESPLIYEAHYFGKNAWDITGAHQTTRYRGTYGNITNTTDALKKPAPSMETSVGSTLHITDQQVVASRGYNVMKVKNDLDTMNNIEGFCKGTVQNKKNPEAGRKAYIQFYRGGNTPINLTGDGPFSLVSSSPELGYNPSIAIGGQSGGTLFDIAGSTLVTGENIAGLSALAVNTFGYYRFVSPSILKNIPIASLKDNSNINPRCVPMPAISTINNEFFKIAKESSQSKNPIVISINEDKYTMPPACITKYYYKTIPSIIKHTSPTPEEVQGMNITTPARGVDTKRYVSFTSLAGNTIQLDYPNLYNVPVYKKDGNIWKIQSPEEIRENIKTYLKNIIQEYNKKLLAENDKIINYISTNKTGFNLLAQKDSGASPINRTYTALPEDFYISLLKEDTIEKIADLLYIKNSPWQSKIQQSTVGETIDQLTDSLHIEDKVYNILDRHLVEGRKGVGINTYGYELAYIRSAGSDTISTSTTIPASIQQAISKIDNNKNQRAGTTVTSTSAMQQQFIDTACNVGSDGTVPLRERPKALGCRWKTLQKNVKEGKVVEISYKNALGPVYPLDQFGEKLKESYTNYIEYVDGIINPKLGADPGNIDTNNSQSIASVNTFTAGSLEIQSPSTILRDGLIPISVRVKNKNNEQLTSLFSPIHISVDKGFFPDSSTDKQKEQQIEITDPTQPVFLDTTGLPANSSIHINASGDNVYTSGSVYIVDGTLRAQINNNTTNNITIQLPNTGYTNTTLGIPVVYENKLPVLQLSLTDSSTKPIHTVAHIASEKNLLQPCKLISNSAGKQCMQESLRDINGQVQIPLLPSMKAGNDTIHIHISGLPERIINVTVVPSDPYKVQVEQTTQKKEGEKPTALFTVYDTWDNIVSKETQVQYTLFGDIKNETNTTQGSISTTSGTATLPINFGKQGGSNYIYASLTNNTASIPGYIRRDTPMNLWPQTGLNVVYLTLFGKDRGNTDNTNIPEMITSSSKLLGVTTTLANPSSTEPIDLEPLRSYGGGKTVGEAWKSTFDPNIIHYGDPMLQHADATKPLPHDTTAVKIAGDENKTIKKTVEFDIDNDGRKDLLILYDDDTVQLMKQYGGTPPYRKLGSLMSIVDGVEEIWIGDANNDKLQDIFVKTKKKTLRVYTNQAGTFPTEGIPVCLDTPDGTKSVDGIWDLEIADMNKDGNMDIVTNDSLGQIRIFHGGATGGDGYYLSSTDIGCDKDRFQRQKDHILPVATFGMSLNEGTKIYDDSLVHREGLTLPSDENFENTPAALSSIPTNKDTAAQFDLEGLMKLGVSDIIRYSGTPYDSLPIYEKNIGLEKIAYVPIRYLTGDDALESYKVYTKGENNTIIVSVYIHAKKNTTATYLEQLRGPWKINKSTDGTISGFSSGSLTNLQIAADNNLNTTINTPIINRNPGNGYQFAIDNISLQAGKTISFSYPVVYTPTQLAHISIEDTNKDGWLDITTKPTDDCTKKRITYESSKGVSYQPTVKEKTDTTNQLAQTQKQAEDIKRKVEEGLVDDIQGLSDIIEKRDGGKTILQNLTDTNALDNGLSFNGSFTFDDSTLFGEKANAWMENAEKTASNILQGACKGFVSGGGSKGLPVPFNVALLAPGDINVFGCKIFKDKGLPVFAFPTTGVPFVPIWPPSSVGAGGWLGGSSSKIRIYVAPTLTQSVGVAICLGPYGTSMRLPSPFRSIGGNCIVFAKRAGSSAKGNNTVNNQDFTENIYDNQDSTSVGSSCRTPYPDTTKPISPLSYGVTNGGDGKINRKGIDPLTMLEKNDRQAATWKDSSVGESAPRGTYLGVLDVDILPEVENNVYKEGNKDTLKGGKPIQLKIQGGNVKGLLKCVVQKWLDNQIRYIANNLTNMSINITIPDIGNIAEGFQNADYKGLEKLIEPFTTSASGKSPAGEALSNLVHRSKGEVLPVGQDDITNINTITANPFNALSSWFDQIPMIRINTKNVNVQVPFIYNEELIKYTAQAESYSKKVTDVYKEREKMVQDIAGTCENIDNELERKACNEQLSKYINTKNDIAKLQSSIKRNLVTLQAYKRFPASLKEWMSVNERYMTELGNTVQGISTDITSWLNTNATRFSSYVDSVILMVGAVKSWQTIINFSTDWKSKCGKCTVDTYDYYSCSLGLLCPNLPILAIPPFKIPNIYVDLSNINIGLDVLLPTIRFVPKRIELPDLPDTPPLPLPPTARGNFNINIPSIPTLPAPPILPQLPSFIPSVDLNLPTLPPAPKIPSISPSISATLKVMTKIGKILCIIKNGIGLVGEGDVKTRIEQLTQRTRNVEPFDSLSTTKVTPPLRGFDIKVSSYLNFEFNFEGLYDVLNNIVKKVNERTNKLITDAREQTNKVSNYLNDNKLTENLGKIEDLNINIQGSIGKDGLQVGGEPLGFTKNILLNNVYTLSNNVYTKNIIEDTGVDAKDFRRSLQYEISAFKQSEFASEYKKEIDTIQGILDTKTDVSPDYASINHATNTLQNLIAEKKSSIISTKGDLDNYDTFLNKINTSALISDTSIQGTISTRLYTVDQKTQHIMNSAENPTKSYLDLQYKLANGFAKALQNHSPDELNMSIFTHTKLLSFFNNTVKDIHTIKGIIETSPQNDTKDSSLKKTTTKAINTLQKNILPEVQAATTEPENKSTSIDMDGKIWRDDHFVYTNQSTLVASKNDGTHYTRYYLFDSIQHYANIVEKAKDNGYISIYNSSFDIGNILPAITSFLAAGSSNNTVSVQWTNTHQSAYLLSLDKNILGNHENNKDKKYVIAYNQNVNLQNTYIDIPSLANKRLSDITAQDNIILVPIDTNNETISLTLDLPEKKRSYIQIAQCMVTPRITTDGNVIRMVSPRSAQETLGAQRQGDTVGPTAIVEFIQRDDKTTIGTGETISLPRNGSYNIHITWQDDEMVTENTWNKKNDNQGITTAGAETTIQNIPIQKDDTPLIYYISATDQAGNTTTKAITITFTDPAIHIESAPKNNNGYDIHSLLSSFYPNGYVRFSVTRDGESSVLSGIYNQQIKTDFMTRSLETMVTGGVFTDADTISLFTPQKQLIARIDKKSGKITPSKEWENRLDFRIDTSSNIPIVLFIDKQNGISLFSLYLRSKQLVNVESIDKGYLLTNLPSDLPGTFGGGKCLEDTKKDLLHTCLLYISQDGNIYTPDTSKVRFGGSYQYDGGVRYTLTLDGLPVLKHLFIPTSLE